ncbi:nSTAND1 domain-containing NTPase [Blastococcus sp. PRF04-17]|uniref:nSTAND1 domain-containing NTPase n=1 Tax=Blastococcus sp. PRF04-17 TaxID=2933797 RepID=UPI001FF6DF05|nr:restriction endonuclease [Blastococcus sp. PRF04-17]UOY03132.1 restriction endonuclease [Blastococcus sp. PRF04-17]
MAVLAEGESAAAISNKRGHLFEKFVAQLLSTQGYEKPRMENLNITSDGIELDVQARHRVTGQRLIAECKAYASNVGAPMLTSFLGKFALARVDDGHLNGLFVGLPRLTQSAREQAEDAQRKFPGFRYIGSVDVCSLLEDAHLLPAWDVGPQLKSDPTVLITEHGLAMAACELDPDSRRASRWVVWSRETPVPTPILTLVEQHLAMGLPVARLEEGVPSVPLRIPAAPSIVEVQGSSSDFEYQLPAAPAFFVGRKLVVEDVFKTIADRQRAGSVVINAKSGWGKSSLMLRLQQEVERSGGVAVVVDARTAESPDFVSAALDLIIRRAVGHGCLTLPDDAAMSSLRSLVETLRHAQWSADVRPLLLAFDQFENVFNDANLTREFRDLAFLLRDIPAPLTVSFSWKTDLVGWTEAHPYRLRDEIRDVSQVVVLEPFGPREVETLLRRLEKSLESKLHRELRQRLREYSQGLPWLFKKLAGHVLTEAGKGITQDELAREALNVQSLFESDLARLSPAEDAALRAIARAAPVAVVDLEETIVSNAVLASLLHQRLVVQVGDRIDTYWDTFRDFLNTGRVAIEDSYVVRYAPLGAGRLLRVVEASGGTITVSDAAKKMDTSVTVIFNYARELRLFGVLLAEANTISIEPELMSASDREESIRGKVAQALRRHKMYKLAAEMLARTERVPLTEFAAALPGEFPTVEAKSDSWFTYARSICQWMDYAGLVTLDRDGIARLSEESPVRREAKLLSGAVPVRVRSAFPGSNAGPALQLLKHLSDPTNVARPSSRSFRPAVRDLSLLGAIELDAGQRIALVDENLVEDGRIDASRLRMVVEQQPGMREAFQALSEDPGATPREIGEAHRSLLRADWASPTTMSVGKFIRGWARACGIETHVRRGPVEPSESQLSIPE